MLTAAKKEKFSAPMVWTDECVLPLAASGVYLKTRVWGSDEKMLHSLSATAQLRIELRRGCEESSGETAAGSALDNNGNTLTKTASGNTTNYTWDYENRLTNVALPGTGGTATFKYDPFGRRIQKVFTQGSTTTTTNYVYDGNNSVQDVDQNGNLLARYSVTQSIDEPLAESRSGTTTYYEADGLASVTSLSNTTGSLANTYTYDSFGKLTASTGSTTNRFLFTAREFDSETGLYYYRARYYDPNSGRFLNEDPLQIEGGIDFYTYTLNNPASMIDPIGEKPCSIQVKCRGVNDGKLNGGWPTAPNPHPPRWTSSSRS
jgi:RHS repeat-associated protein